MKSSRSLNPSVDALSYEDEGSGDGSERQAEGAGICAWGEDQVAGISPGTMDRGGAGSDDVKTGQSLGVGTITANTPPWSVLALRQMRFIVFMGPFA